MFPSSCFPRHAAIWRAIAARHATGELAHDGEHVARVYRWALKLAPEASADADLCGAAALVHDVSLVPKDDPNRAEGGARAAVLADAVLRGAGYDETDTAAICAAVATSSWSKGLSPANAIGVVLQDADRLDAIGAIGLCRNLACAQSMSRLEKPGRFYDPQDPAGINRILDDRLNALDHLPVKLQKLAASMHLPSAIAEARRRHDFLLAFRAELLADIRIP
jgi:uncharacterized protein